MRFAVPGHHSLNFLQLNLWTYAQFLCACIPSSEAASSHSRRSHSQDKLTPQLINAQYTRFLSKHYDAQPCSCSAYCLDMARPGQGHWQHLLNRAQQNRFEGLCAIRVEQWDYTWMKCTYFGNHCRVFRLINHLGSRCSQLSAINVELYASKKCPGRPGIYQKI